MTAVMRRATLADRPAILDALLAQAERAMFPLSNLLTHGMEGGHARAMRLWTCADPASGVLGLTEEGMVMPVLPPHVAPAAATVLHGARVMGFAGEARASLALRAALGLDGAKARLAHVEPHYALALHALRMPPVAGLTLTPLADPPRDLMIDWIAAYDVEALGARPEDARGTVDLDAWAAADSHRVLWRGGAPVARTGFNATAPGIVQVGGVYVPPALRRQSLARAAVALHLREVQGRGVRRATLFAANPAAARAYEALGFLRIGEFLLCLLDGPREVRAA